jgi:two-component system, OmpR family, response regulator
VPPRRSSCRSASREEQYRGGEGDTDGDPDCARQSHRGNQLNRKFSGLLGHGTLLECALKTALRHRRGRSHDEPPIKDGGNRARGDPVYSRPMARRIALVEDEPMIRANYVDALRRHGYEVVAYAGRREAMEAFRARLPDLAVIDIGLGDEAEGGFALCRELRALSSQLPIVFLTARDSDFDVVSGLRLGADDYVTKGVSLPHLLARIGALFRRIDALREERPVEERIVRGPLELDLKRFLASWRERKVELTLTEFWIVHSLARHPGHVKNREQLMRDAELVVDDATITSHIKRMRAKFVAADSSFDAIETVYGLGYRWKA